MPHRSITCVLMGSVLSTFALCSVTTAHDHTRHKFEKSRRVARLKTAAILKEAKAADNSTCALAVDVIDDDSNQSVPSLIRVTNLETGKYVELADQIQREQGWYAVEKRTTITVPKAKMLLEGIIGLETKTASEKIDVTNRTKATTRLRLKRFYDADSKGLKSGNTHLHLMNLTLGEAHRYLRLVPKADDLDLVFLSHLLRVPDDVNYISNVFVLNSFGGGDLKRLSQGGVLFSNGQEHRHNFGAYDEGYGHVMFLDIVKLVEPVSIGPGIMKKGTDGIPLQRGIKTARRDGASVIWCHNHFGLEDGPNWMTGVVDAQNIFDGGDHGSYDRSFYRYLNLGLKVPFSTGTDWFIYDFSRVYVPLDGKLTSKKWLDQLRQGRTFITNGPFLEFHIGKHKIGDTIQLSSPDELTISAHAVGRIDFKAVEIVHNGKVIHASPTVKKQAHFQAQVSHIVKITQPSWLAVRIPRDSGTNEFGKMLFAHTSPIYVNMNGKRVFQPTVAKELIDEMETNIKVINEKALFANQAERESVIQVHRAGIEKLKDKLKTGS